jgi:hypothetical protein
VQYCVILEVESLTEATALGMQLQRLGCKVVSARVKPSQCALGVPPAIGPAGKTIWIRNQPPDRCVDVGKLDCLDGTERR